MFVKILREAGYEEALLGLSLSFYDHKIPLVDWDAFYIIESWDEHDLHRARSLSSPPYNNTEYFWTNEKFYKARKIALHLANKQVPENYETRNNLAYISAEQKFLEQIDVWIYIQASRDFWSEFDTYRVDMSKQSSSTMHTLSKREVTMADFEEGTNPLSVACLNRALAVYNSPEHSSYHDVSRLKKNLPEGWLQERVVKTSYKTLKWILEQRDGHRLESWKVFYREVFEQLQHPEYIKPMGE